MLAVLKTLCFATMVVMVVAENQQPAPTVADNVAQYVAGQGQVYNPTSGYQYTEPNYGPVQGYDNYMVPYSAHDDDDDSSLSTFQYFGSILPYARGRSSPTITPEMIILAKFLIKVIAIYWHPEIAKMVVYRIITKVGAFLLGGSILLVIGGLFMTALCAMTPLCTIQFMGIGVNRETMRSYMTPANLGAASAFVQDAIDKYSKLQGAVSPKHPTQ